MPAAPLLSSAQIGIRLAALPLWRLAYGRLMRTVQLRDFRSALDLVTRIADPADEQNHHPDSTIHWNVVTLTLWTHASDTASLNATSGSQSIGPVLSSPRG